MANIDINRLLLRYRVASISTLILGIALSTLAFVAVDSRERGALRTAFDDAAAHVQSAITLALQRNVYMADSVGALFDSSNDTTHPQFVVFTKQLLTHMRGVQALEWIPLVPSAMRNSYEKAAQEAFPRFEFTERKAQGEMVRAAARDEYFPVYFVEPVAGNQAAIGFDLGSNPVRLEALTRARDTGQIVATGRITLVQEMATEYGILLFRPVYRSGLPHDTNEQRHNNLLGFALGVFRIGEVINAATGPLKSSGINAVIYDDSAPTSERFLASWPAMTQTDPSQAEQAQGKPELERIESFDVGGRRWTLVLTPTKALYSTTVPRVAWVMLMAGLLFSGLLAAYIEAARKHLREELGSREARLAAEEKLTDILGSIDSAVVSIKPSTGELLYANRAAVQILGRSPAELAKNNKLWLDAVHPDDKRNIYERLSLPQKTSSFSDEFRFIRPSGEVRWVGSKAKVIPDATGNVARIDIVASDITERMRGEDARRVSQRILEIANRQTKLSPMLEEFVAEVRSFTGCAAVGLRLLDEKGNISCQADMVSSRGFYESESPLSIKSDHCMCIDAIKEAADPKLSFYTKGGSFYMNGSTRFLATVSEEEQGRIRSVCNKVEYESAALMPIRTEGRILGLIYVADPRENMVPLEIVNVLEGLVMQLGTAIERTRTREAISISREQLRALATRLNVAREEEAAMVAREIHDDLGQMLTGLKMDLSWLASRLPENAPALAQKALSMSGLVDDTMQFVRDIARRLRPGILEDLGLIPAVEWQIREFQKRTGVKCEMVTAMDAVTLGPEQPIVIYRIIQEALNNVARHAAATEVDIDFHEEPGCLMLEVRDNGKGIRAADVASMQSLGLLGMRERALALSGELSVEGFPGRGTVVSLRLPFPAQ